MPGFASEVVVWEQVGCICLDLPIPLDNQCGVALVQITSVGGLHRVSDGLLDCLVAHAMVANLLDAYDVSLTTVWTPSSLSPSRQ